MADGIKGVPCVAPIGIGIPKGIETGIMPGNVCGLTANGDARTCGLSPSASVLVGVVDVSFSFGSGSGSSSSEEELSGSPVSCFLCCFRSFFACF